MTATSLAPSPCETANSCSRWPRRTDARFADLIEDLERVPHEAPNP
jgi:hypothetical protein